jgi:CDP-diglyceride synthetase
VLTLTSQGKSRPIFIWVFCIIGFVINDSGISGKISGVYNYSWGNIFRPDTGALLGTASWLIVFHIFVWASCWFLFRAYRRESAPIARRHILYILISFFVISLANVKIAVLYGIDNGFLMPTGMLFIDILAALIGVAIIKHRLLDITLIVKKGTLYSLFVALIIFLFSCSEHLLSKYLGDLLGEQPIYIHLISIAVVVGVLMPVRQRLDRAIDRSFGKKKLEF